MSTDDAAGWVEANQQGLARALDAVRADVEAVAIRPDGGDGRRQPADDAADAADGADPVDGADAADGAVDALDALCAGFGLTAFERRVLLLCAGVELDARFGAACAAAHGDPTRTYPTWGLALAALPGAHWSALAPSAPLRRWRLVELGGAGPLTATALRIDERVLHHLVGVTHLDDRLVGLAEPVRCGRDLLPSEEVVAEEVADLWATPEDGMPLPVVQLCGTDPAVAVDVAAAALARLGLDLLAVPARRLSSEPRELETVVRLLEREATLGGYAVLLDHTDVETPDPARETALAQFVAGIGVPLLTAAPHRLDVSRRRSVVVAIPPLRPDEQRESWHRALGDSVDAGTIDRLVARFDLGPWAIRDACGQAGAGGNGLPAALWAACRAGSRTGLDALATLVEPRATWDDLVVPAPQRALLEQIAAHVDHRHTVFDRWGLGRFGARGLGTSVLFTGASGTGKTLAAEVLARELGLDLYRVDLSRVVSKYIGETEKNLRRVFDTADRGSAVLLFDEADALFGRRSEVKDSHDRYANIEVGYLLQRMEAYRGLAVLTTNLRDALDPAFLRRLRFVVHFPFPDTALRAAMWSRAFPPETPTEDLDTAKLAGLDVTGGTIRAIAVNAAFLAATGDEAVSMPHVLRAARAEYAKLDKVLAAPLVADWVSVR
jgi:hypothetical protein